MIHEANRLGINYFDTAPFYNDDQSEKFLVMHLKICLMIFMFLQNLSAEWQLIYVSSLRKISKKTKC